MSPRDNTIEHVLREIAPQVLGALARRHRDFASAEDALQEALLAASIQWPTEGLPENPAGWLFTTALRRLTDQIRSESARRRREEQIAQELDEDETMFTDSDEVFDPHQDDTLVLMFMCSHPSLSSASAIALTLRAVGGLTTAEIAKAFLVPEATMAQRISRAKQSIVESDLPFSLPAAAERAERIGAVMHVLYLIFNEGYTSSSGTELQRVDLSNEAIRVTRSLHELAPDDAEVAGLLALMLLTDARRAARVGSAGELIPLDEQDRALWDRSLIAEGVHLIATAIRKGRVGVYQLQAAIAALHDQAESTGKTDWVQIESLYGLLHAMNPNPMVALSRAVATAMVQGPSVGLQRIDEIARDSKIKDHYRLDAARGHLYERAEEYQLAAEHYRRAAQGTASLPERNYLLGKAARVSAAHPVVSREVNDRDVS